MSGGGRSLDLSRHYWGARADAPKRPTSRGHAVLRSRKRLRPFVISTSLIFRRRYRAARVSPRRTRSNGRHLRDRFMKASRCDAISSYDERVENESRSTERVIIRHPIRREDHCMRERGESSRARAIALPGDLSACRAAVRSRHFVATTRERLVENRAHDSVASENESPDHHAAARGKPPQAAIAGTAPLDGMSTTAETKHGGSGRIIRSSSLLMARQRQPASRKMQSEGRLTSSPEGGFDWSRPASRGALWGR